MLKKWAKNFLVHREQTIWRDGSIKKKCIRHIKWLELRIGLNWITIVIHSVMTDSSWFKVISHSVMTYTIWLKFISQSVIFELHELPLIQVMTLVTDKYQSFKSRHDGVNYNCDSIKSNS